MIHKYVRTQQVSVFISIKTPHRWIWNIFKRITKLENGGRNARHGTPIEIYPDIPKPSAVEDKTFRKKINGKPIREKDLIKTHTRLNKWDMEKILSKNKKKK